ncbi:uncharacterized protein N7515_005772 [Penicillium bovifimosum]|uniref:RING-type E3 ubiquitin transferase n=1 Tax=Penicillium bovifimosum TaxID=126998 RepID=A0A9W9GTP4_9EURO|nr:uncharacterized protein N7515_005772 [Penicillium bovifimosum]KAJ5129733.1 hypothetical protein N7515_005772 [Penicillium bovifimosum]
MDSDRMFCHACGGVWLKDGGLTCPHCESEFTEIIEIPPEMPSEASPSPQPQAGSSSAPRGNPWRDHNPWEQEESYSAQGLGLFGNASSGYPSLRTYRSPDGRFSFSSTTFEAGTASGQRNDPSPIVPMALETFGAMLRDVDFMEPNPRVYRGYGEESLDPNSSTAPDWLQDDHLTGHHPGLSPRNTNGPQSNRNPMTITEIMDAIRADLGTQSMRGGRGGRGAAAPNPLSILSAILNMDRIGDAVYSQEALDRVIEQLIEHTGGASTAPPAASQTAIQSLPRKKVDKEMLGGESKAECTICLDNVELGTEVTVLPCTHWFHFSCIEAWLTQNNTCPHCRRGIDSNMGNGEGTRENPVVVQDSPEQSASRRRHSSARTSRSGRSSLSSLQSRLSPRLSPRRSPERERGQGGQPGPRELSRSEGNGGGFASWFSNRFGNST